MWAVPFYYTSDSCITYPFSTVTSITKWCLEYDTNTYEDELLNAHLEKHKDILINSKDWCR